ncbi:MAG: non-homologous end-joining DNA ligase [Actinobacteria bacterium]|nr:non-homologous end-joining DNA ligase [Actinomycetota bacterium]
MLPTSTQHPFDSPDHVFEVKWDGVRVLAFCDRSGTRLTSRAKRDVTHQYPEFKDLHTRLEPATAVLDGEIVALDFAGRPSFELLQKRINVARPTDIARSAAGQPLQLVLFDLLFADGRWLGNLPLAERIVFLDGAVRFGDRILRSEPISEYGLALFEAARARGLEGVVAKRSASHYVPGKRTRDWLKIKTVYDLDCVVCGYTAGNNSRSSSVGALLLGVYEGTELRHVGSVGTGFDESTLAALRRRLDSLRKDKGPFRETVPVRGVRWVEPLLVCKVEYRELTAAKKLRAPSFKGLRDDKRPQECRLPES